MFLEPSEALHANSFLIWICFGQIWELLTFRRKIYLWTRFDRTVRIFETVRVCIASDIFDKLFWLFYLAYALCFGSLLKFIHNGVFFTRKVSERTFFVHYTHIHLWCWFSLHIMSNTCSNLQLTSWILGGHV